MRPRAPSTTTLRDASRGPAGLLAAAFFFSVFVNLLMLTGPLFMLQVYDRVLTSRSEETLVALLILVAGLYVLMWLLDTARGQIVARYAARVQSALDGPVFARALRRDGISATEAASATRHLDAVQACLASPALTAAMDIPFTPLFLAAIFVFHAELGWLALAGGGALIFVAALNQWTNAARAAEAQTHAEAAHAFGEQMRRNGDLVQVLGAEAAVGAHWRAARSATLAATLAAQDRTGALSALGKSLRLALQSLILALGAWLVLRGEVSAGAMIAASILLGRALAPVEQLLARWPQVERARHGWRALARLLDEPDAAPARMALPRPESRLSVRGLTVSGGPGRPPLLFNLSFELAPGEALGVIGRSGAGKTTLARILTGLVRPTAGEVRLGGALLSHYPPEALAGYLGYLPQDAALLPGTIGENIARLDRAPESGHVIAAAQGACAHELILSLPEGYDTRLEDAARTLSGGQRQRIALARALFGEPALLILDEPNSALDAEGTEALNAAIRAAKAGGRSVIVMTHRPMAISECDRLMVLDGGRIAALGPRDDVLRSMMKNAGDIQVALAAGERR